MAATRSTYRPPIAPSAVSLTPPARRGHSGTRAASGYALLAATLLLHLAALLVIFPNTREDVVMRGFLQLTFHDSGATLVGAVPYRDFLLEYPPGTLLFMLLPRLFATGYLDYRSLFFLQVTLLDCIVVLALYASARTAALSPLRVLGLYTLAIALLGPIVDYRLDIAPVALTALAVLAWQRDRPVLAAMLLAAGTATKVYPALLLPPLLYDAWIRRGRRSSALALLGFAAALALLLSPALAAGPWNVLHNLRFQTNRHLQVESIWATPPLLLHLATGFPLEVVGRHRALVILGPGDAWGAAGTPALVLVALATYAAWWRAYRRGRERRDILFVGTATLVLASAMLSKVLSPQFLLWAMPSLALLPMSRGTHQRAAGIATVAALVLFLAALPLTQWIYPLHYGELVRYIAPAAVSVLALRNLLLVLTLALLITVIWGRRGSGQRFLVTRKPASPDEPAALSDSQQGGAKH